MDAIVYKFADYWNVIMNFIGAYHWMWNQYSAFNGRYLSGLVLILCVISILGFILKIVTNSKGNENKKKS